MEQTWNKNTIIKWGICFALAASCFLLPTTDFITMEIKWFFVITVFGLSLMAFELVPMVVIGALMPALWILMGVAPIATVMSPWTSSVMYMLIGMFFLAAACEQSGLLRRISFMIMSAVGSNYWALLLGIFAVGVALSVITFGAIAHVIVGALCYGLCKSLDIMDTKLSASIAIAVMLGCCSSHMFVYSSLAYAVIMELAADILAQHQIAISFINIFLHNWPMLVVCLITLFVLGKMYKPEDMKLGSREYFKNGLAEMGKMSKSEKANAVVLILILIYLLTQQFHGLDMNLGFFIFPWLLLIPGIDGADSNTVRKTNWDVIIFSAGCMAIGNIASSFGFGAVISEYAVPIFQSAGNSIALVFTTLFGLVFGLNFLMTPLAIWALITEPMVQIASALSINPLTFIYALVTGAEAIVLPYEYIPYLIIFSFGMIKMKDFIIASVIRCVILLAGFLFILIPYWNLIGILFV